MKSPNSLSARPFPCWACYACSWRLFPSLTKIISYALTLS
jgi:hypothetical protein